MFKGIFIGLWEIIIFSMLGSIRIPVGHDNFQ